MTAIGAASQSANLCLPLWLRIAYYAQERTGADGHHILRVGELRELDPAAPASSISRALAQAVHRELLDPISSARCLVLLGAGRRACPALHRAPR